VNQTHFSLEYERLSFQQFVLHLCRTFDRDFNMSQSLAQVTRPLVDASEIILAAVEILKQPMLSETNVTHTAYVMCFTINCTRSILEPKSIFL